MSCYVHIHCLDQRPECAGPRNTLERETGSYTPAHLPVKGTQEASQFFQPLQSEPWNTQER